MCQSHTKEMKVGFPTIRRFGVELEGFVNKNDIQGYHRTGDVTWDIGDDGSLDDNSDECNNCDGCGRHDCGTCEGRGRESCEECSGSGNKRCDICSGGYVECSTCDGSGECEDDIGIYVCENCGGSGKTDCNDCDGYGNQECNECSGRGDSVCGNCDGAGREDCASCDGDGYTGDGSYGVEARSEPLKHTESIHKMYEYLHENGWHVNNSAGLHVHVEADDYDNESFQKILALMTGIEPIIYSMNGRHRFSGMGYCKPITRYRTNVMRNLSTPCGYGYRREFSSERYMGLNFQAFTEHDTIEFRYFSPQENSERVEHFVELATKIVEFAKQATMEQILVIVKHLIANKNNFDVLAQVIQETLQLSYTPWDESGVYREYNWFSLEDITKMEIGLGLIQPITATIGQTTQVV